MTRQPQIVGLDLRGLHRLERGRARAAARAVDRYGADTVTTVMEELIRYSERRMRERLRSLPDGEFRAPRVPRPRRDREPRCTGSTSGS